MANQHHILPDCVRSKSCKRELFISKIFQGTVGQLIAATDMVTGKNGGSAQIFRGLPSLLKKFINASAKTEISDNDGIRPGTGKPQLRAMVDQSAVQGPAKHIPAIAFAAKLCILPDIFFAGFVETLPISCAFGKRSNVLVHLSVANITDTKLLADFKNLLIKKATVNSNNDRNIISVFFSDTIHHVRDHFLDGVTMIRMLVAATKNCINKIPSTIHL